MEKEGTRKQNVKKISNIAKSYKKFRIKCLDSDYITIYNKGRFVKTLKTEVLKK